jgi:hypothetical protein
MKTKRRLLRQAIHEFFTDLESPEDLVAYMNARHGRPGFDRLEHVVHAINKIDRLARIAGYPDASMSCAKFGDEAQRLKSSLVDRFTSEFQFVVGLRAPRARGWSQSYKFFPNASPHKSMKSLYLGGIFIYEAACRGFLRRIHQCSICGKWFVMKFETHKSCSERCRVKSFRSSAEGKARRARYMREYRAREKRRDAAILRAVQKGKG